MDSYKKIEEKLKLFSKKYYTNELIKGSILFISLGVLYFFLTLFIELFLWLQPTARTFLFWLFIVIEVGLFIRFIVFPIFKLIGLKKGISLEECSKIIGAHFKEVGDKLLNILQLKNNPQQSELLLASIEQKSLALKPIPFAKAINFKNNRSYLKYAFIPFIIWIFSFFSGTNRALSESFKRVVNHRTAYVPPAPFSFYIENNKLEVIQGKPITVIVKTEGKVVPEEVKINFNNQQYYLKNEGKGLFSYTFSEVNQPIPFYLEANGITSLAYKIAIIKTPTINQLKMRLLYPSYLQRQNKTVLNTGNSTVPKGTVIQWQIASNQTDSIHFVFNKNRIPFQKKEKNAFFLSKKITQNTAYLIATSNSNLKNYEKLQYSIEVVEDEHPSISVNSNIDSISRGTALFAGQIADDYGLKKLELVYYNIQKPQAQQTFNLPISKEAIQSFYYEFPNGLNLEKGIDYELFFQVFDNDAVNGSKKTASRTFSYRQKTTQEIEETLLKEQKNTINNLQKTLNKQQENKKDLEKIQFNLQNKEQLNWNDQKKIETVLKRQEQYQKMMQRQTEKLQENFDEKQEQTPSLQEKKEELKNRIAELKRSKKEKKLLKELKEMAQKLNKEDLVKKAKKLSEQNKQQERSLERILEMTKRFYVEQKSTQLANKLEELAKKQEELTKKNTNKEEQKEINNKFKKTQEELKELQKENEKLKEPMPIPAMEELQKQTEQELNNAKKNIEEQKLNNAKKNQKNAAQKMRKMSQKMQQNMQTMSAEMQEENKEDLRAILENLITFSFEQEDLMALFENSTTTHPNFGKNLKKQNQLKTYFEHIDDSLYVLSMRVPKISAKIQDALADAHYNLNLSLDNFTENRFSAGISNQRYVITATNILSDMLSNVSDAMQNASMSMGSGKGKKGKSFSLPDIIKKQEKLIEKMKEGMKKGLEGKPKNGKNGSGEKGNTEEQNENLYKIYKEQSKLKQELQNAMPKEGKQGENAKKAVKKMEQLENEILEKGFNKNTLEKMQLLNYQLLKLNTATFKQGEDKKRKSETNLREFKNNNTKKLQFKKQFYNQTEILNRQSLPLRQDYKKKVKEYFSIPSEN